MREERVHGGYERHEMKVTNLGEAVGVGANDCDVAGLGVRVVLWDVLLHGELEDVVLGAGEGAGELADV